MTNLTQINQGGAQNQEKQPPEQTCSQQVPDASKSKGELTEGRPEPSSDAKAEKEARKVVEGGEEDQQSNRQTKTGRL